ncbi:hypothetical protein DB347_13110 [Opitutaceae bacterium EW11]|nr:hypothetical protein DB347_13110 [Opitutaceae bacterium EW11]
MNTTIALSATLGCVLVCLSPAALAADMPTPEQETPSIGLQLGTQLSASVGNKFKARGTEFRDVDIGAAEFSAEQTLKLSDTAALQVGFAHSLYDVHVRKGGVVPLPKRMQSLSAPLTLNLAPGGAWNWTVVAAPGFSFAGNSIRSDGFGVSAGAFGTCKQSDTFSYSVGVAYDSLASSRYKVFPVFGVEWKPADRWSVALGIPRTGVSFQVNQQLGLSLDLSGNAGTFYVKDDPLPNRADKPDLSKSKLEYAEARIGFTVSYRVNKVVALQATAGHVLVSELEYLKRDYKLKSKGVSPFLALGGSFSF